MSHGKATPHSQQGCFGSSTGNKRMNVEFSIPFPELRQTTGCIVVLREGLAWIARPDDQKRMEPTIVSKQLSMN